MNDIIEIERENRVGIKLEFLVVSKSIITVKPREKDQNSQLKNVYFLWK